jgi:uncharacterized DUF497 family protein
MEYNFIWDPAKARRNVKKHGVTFELAAAIFQDPMALTIYDDDNSDNDEDRWVTLGLVNEQHYLSVIHTYHDQHNNAVTIRLISARLATKHEIRDYEG